MSYYSRRSSRYSRSTSRYDHRYSYYGFAPYVPVAERRAKALAAAKKAAQNGIPLSPVEITGRNIATTFWGKAWCQHLESYSDFENRLPRGRTYVRNGSVIDLQITKGKITAQVSGSEIYTETITIKPLASARWESIKQKCAGRIDSLVDLLKGTLSDAVMRVITDRDHGLFPAPAEIEKNCSCPDVAGLCKHLAAVLYGVGARLDTQPELLFLLRGVDHRELIAAAAAGATQLAPADAAAGTTAALSESQLADVFGIDIAPVAHSATPASPPPPANPASTKPAKPTKPVTPTKPAKLAKPAKSAKSAKPAKIAKTAKTACAKKPSTRSSSPSPAKKLPARKKNARKAKKPRKKNTAPNVAQT